MSLLFLLLSWFIIQQPILTGKLIFLLMLHIALFEPEIPPNTGNIIRLCANSGAKLHLIEPLGFDLSEKQCRRAGLDYHDIAKIDIHKNYDEFRIAIKDRRTFYCSTHGKTYYADTKFQDEDVLVFGPESRGLPKPLLAAQPGEHVIKIPMQANNRSLNLSNSVAIILYEAWRQLEFNLENAVESYCVF